MSDIIFETIVLEATNKVKKLVKSGKGLDEAVLEVSDDLMLTGRETEEVKIRAKKVPTPKISETDADLDVEPENLDPETVAEPTVTGNTITFSPATIDTAIGVLMYKGIPWVTRDGCNLTFASSEDVESAKEVLKRRWEFVLADRRKVATIEFDNLEDYMKVLSFMQSKRMTAIINNSDVGLDNDVSVELAEMDSAHTLAVKMAKKEGLPAPEKPETSMSYVALDKDSSVDLGSLDPIVDAGARSIVVMKRW